MGGKLKTERIYSFVILDFTLMRTSFFPGGLLSQGKYTKCDIHQVYSTFPPRRSGYLEGNSSTVTKVERSLRVSILYYDRDDDIMLP